MNAAGSCLCGGVNIVIPEIAEEITVCHCHMCQKFWRPVFVVAGNLVRSLCDAG